MQVECKDGFSMSVIEHDLAYCDKESVEIGFPSEREDLIMSYAESPDKPTRTVYGYVPKKLLEKVIEKHKGMKW